MKVLVAGASGTLGRPLVQALLTAGHEVSGVTRTPAKAALLEALGARPVVVDALDAEALASAVAEAGPEAIVHLLTALPKRGPTRFGELKATNRLRIEGTHNLLAAARAAGARRFVAESVVFAYGFGDHGEAILDEATAPSDEKLGRGCEEAQRACLLLESQLLDASRDGALEGVTLRLGFLYGPGVPSAEFMLRMLRRRMMALPGGGQAVVPWVEIGDTVAAFVAALKRGPGGETYNIVDDQAVSIAEFASELARVFSTPKPYGVPHWLARLAMPAGAQLLGRTRLHLSNAKAKQLLAWAPQRPGYRAGLRAWHEQVAGAE